MRHGRREWGRGLAAVAALACAWPAVCRIAAAQGRTGELRLEVRDTAGLALEAGGELISQANQVRFPFRTDRHGRYTARALPFGTYLLRVEREGFAAAGELVEIRSELPLSRSIALGVAPLETAVRVTDTDTVLDPQRVATMYYIGSERLRERRASGPGRAALELVQAQPGWLTEANGVLHPRGAEYNVQYVVDGVPMLDNRSPAFAPPVDTEELEAMDVLTAGYPAEYGRKLGGVIEAATGRRARPGLHGRAAAEAGSFATSTGFASVNHTRGRYSAGLSFDVGHTNRFLDPPVEENFTNTWSGAGATARLEADLSDRDRVRAYLHRKRSGFLVPNELAQQEAGQRQDRRNLDTQGQIAWQRVLSPRALATLRGMGREVAADLWSNARATPMEASQARGFRQGYAAAALSVNPGSHELKFGGDAFFTAVHERFAYRVSDPSFFAEDTPPAFRFSDRRSGREYALYVQDLARLGRWTLSAGLRWDQYSLLIRERAWSPRLGASYHLAEAGLVLRASYDRAFETPPLENLLLASSPAARRLSAGSAGLAVPPSRGNYYQAGLAKSLPGGMRLDANWFRRRIRNFSDDDVLLNTGVSFPITFASAVIQGIEARLDLPRWRRFSGFASYSNLSGTGRLPITGGLFLEEADELLRSVEEFRITQDQRNTAQAQLRFQICRRAWIAAGARYGSGLPVELEHAARDAELAGRFSPRILARVNLARGRVRPQYSLDASAGVELWRREQRSARVQADAGNLTDRLNVINFAGLFSGTALGPPRSAAVRLLLDF